MNSMSKPSFPTCYYIRKILLQKQDELKWVLAQQSGFCMTSEAELKELLTSVYLEDVLEQLLAKLYLEESEITNQVQKLEKLVLRHQSLVANNVLHSGEVLELERQLFWILGFKRLVVKMEDLVEALNKTNQFIKNYLGAMITFNNWQSTIPKSDEITAFKINRANGFQLSGIDTEFATAIQIQKIQEWVNAFVKQSSQVVMDLPTTIKQQRIGELPQGILLIEVGCYSSWLNEKINLPQKLPLNPTLSKK